MTLINLIRCIEVIFTLWFSVCFNVTSVTATFLFLITCFVTSQNDKPNTHINLFSGQHRIVSQNRGMCGLKTVVNKVRSFMVLYFSSNEIIFWWFLLPLATSILYITYIFYTCIYDIIALKWKKWGQDMLEGELSWWISLPGNRKRCTGQCCKYEEPRYCLLSQLDDVVTLLID
jgi:hypothetical protein